MKWFWGAILLEVTGISIVLSSFSYPDWSLQMVLVYGAGLILVCAGSFLLSFKSDDILDAWADRRFAKHEAETSKEDDVS